ncbi:ATP-binding protein [Micromonospora sp. CA-249363]|uniref:ATP-binding protein n=1 Tax=Micromonospora sp. CA-249363 TaxID=3239963 RepID=UPI003D8C4FE1
MPGDPPTLEVPDGVRNDLSGQAGSAVLQAGSIGGDVHFHGDHGHRSIPRQLPAGVSRFVGRTNELAALDAALDAPDSTGTIIISAISGAGGIGKTALALRWARQLADRYPDGQLYADLRGFAPDADPVDPAEVIRGFLDALGVAADKVPVSVAAQSALFRSLVAGRRVLVVLDNARNSAQVRPLLPGDPSCLVVITSRNDLADLVAQEGARPLKLDVLTPVEATALIAEHVGGQMVASEPDAVARLVEACSGLPLAVAIVAARAATRPNFSLRDIAQDLSGEDPLSSFDGVDRSVRAVFSWSYRTLSPAAARVFGLLGLNTGADISLAGVASLAGIPLAEARELMNELTAVHLVDEHLARRFRLHDLLQTYAARLAATGESAEERGTAIRRLLDFYLTTSFWADRALDPARDPIHVIPSSNSVSPVVIEDIRQALEWFTGEKANLLAAVDVATRSGEDGHAWQLAWALNTYFYWRSDWRDLAMVQEAAVEAAVRLDDLQGQVKAYRGLGRALTSLERDDEALAHNERALVLSERLRDFPNQAASHHAMSVILDRLERFEEALHHARRALDLSRRIGNRSREARALRDVGIALNRLSSFEEGVRYCTESADLFRAAEDTHGEAVSLDHLANALAPLGRYPEAIEHLTRAASLHHLLGNIESEAATLDLLGDFHLAVEDTRSARRTWRQCLDLLRQLGSPRIKSVRSKIRSS